VVPNEEYRLERIVVPSHRYAAEQLRHVVGRPDLGMAYGRLSVARDGFLGEAILSLLRPVASGVGRPSPVEFPEVAGLTRAVFRGQVGSDYGKRLRWRLEKQLGHALSGRRFFRNQLLSEPAAVFENRSAASTDILHEYFLPPESLEAFLQQLRSIIPRHQGGLLNLTVRQVLEDKDTFLRYADQPMLACVLLFNQRRTSEGDAEMAAMTRDMIDAALHLGGRYYLPYRPHATIDQFQTAYPQAPRFFALKRRYDPNLLFQNEFYLRYGAIRETAWR
jgi:FAD/FMN-containing dehydrogenase